MTTELWSLQARYSEGVKGRERTGKPNGDDNDGTVVSAGALRSRKTMLASLISRAETVRPEKDAAPGSARGAQ